MGFIEYELASMGRDLNSPIGLSVQYVLQGTWTHLFGVQVGMVQSQRVQDVFTPQEQAVMVLIQKHSAQGKLTMVTTEDRGPVGGHEVCGGRRGRRMDGWMDEREERRTEESV